MFKSLIRYKGAQKNYKKENNILQYHSYFLFKLSLYRY